jgi:thiol-disulfide isomerase/thioredoxin
MVMHQGFGGYERAFSGPENRYLTALAEHLTRTGARFYGAYWCPHCQHQKALFGPAAKKLPYTECSPHGGPGTPLATDCLSADIKRYRTWHIRDKPHAKMLTIAELAALSGFELPQMSTPAQ